MAGAVDHTSSTLFLGRLGTLRSSLYSASQTPIWPDTPFLPLSNEISSSRTTSEAGRTNARSLFQWPSTRSPRSASSTPQATSTAGAFVSDVVSGKIHDARCQESVLLDAPFASSRSPKLSQAADAECKLYHDLEYVPIWLWGSRASIFRLLA